MAPRDGFTDKLKRFARGRTSGGGGRPTYNPSGSGSDAPKPLGVPEDYTAPFVRTGRYSPVGGETAARMNRSPGTIGAQGPRYFEGAEWGPAGTGPAAIGALQEHMAASGLLTGDWRYGIWDENTRKAYKSVLEEANAMGLTAQAVIQLRGQSASFGGSGEDGGGSGGSGGGGGTWQYDENGNPVFVPDPEDVYTPPPLELKLTNIDDLRSVFRRSVIDTLGVGWSQAQVDAAANAYRAEEERVQREAYNRQVSIERADFEGTRGAGGETITSVDVASPEAFLEQRMIEQDPEGYKSGRLIEDAIPAFFQSLQGWV